MTDDENRALAERLALAKDMLRHTVTQRDNMSERLKQAEPCMTEADLKPGDPGIPCTFDPTPQQLKERLKACEAIVNETPSMSLIRDPVGARAEVEAANERALIMFDAKNKWADRARKAEAERNQLTADLARVTAERDRLRAALEGIRETATNGVLSGEFAATEICAEIFSVAQVALREPTP